MNATWLDGPADAGLWWLSRPGHEVVLAQVNHRGEWSPLTGPCRIGDTDTAGWRWQRVAAPVGEREGWPSSPDRAGLWWLVRPGHGSVIAEVDDLGRWEALTGPRWTFASPTEAATLRWQRIAPPVDDPAPRDAPHVGIDEARREARMLRAEAEACEAHARSAHTVGDRDEWEVSAQRALAAAQRSPMSATLSAHDHVRELVAERDEARARAAKHHQRGDEARHEAAELRARVAEFEALACDFIESFRTEVPVWMQVSESERRDGMCGQCFRLWFDECGHMNRCPVPRWARRLGAISAGNPRVDALKAIVTVDDVARAAKDGAK